MLKALRKSLRQNIKRKSFAQKMLLKMFAENTGYKFSSNVISQTDMGQALSSWIDNQTGTVGYSGAVSISHANDNTLFSYRKLA